MPVSMINVGLEAVGKAIKEDIKQARFAAAVALTRTARTSTDAARGQARQDLDKPTPFTLRGFRWEKATKDQLQSRVYLAPIQAQYLFWQVEGGTRGARASTGEALPTNNVRLNKYGNIPARHKGRIRQWMNQPDTFVGTVRGVHGLWQRGRVTKTGRFTRAGKKRKDRLKLLLRFEPTVKYKPKYQFQQINADTFDREFDRQYTRAYADAIQPRVPRRGSGSSRRV